MAKKETIVVKSEYCARMNDPVTQQILKRSFPVKTGYWISRALDKIRQETKAYNISRNKLIETHADKEKQKEAEKKGTATPGQTILKDVNAFNQEIETLNEIELDLGIDKMDIDLEVLEAWLKERGEKELSVGELEFLLPFFNVK